MSALYRNFRGKNKSFPAMLARLLIMIFAMQSVVAMADNCSFEHQDCDENSEYLAVQVNEMPPIDASDISLNLRHEDRQSSAALCDDGFVVSIHVDDDCDECSDNCCSCCMTLMHPDTIMQNNLVHSNYVAFTFTSTAVESPYFSFLRPPQA
ncbi:hypothetical protein BCU94_11485 [Shewanella sp. 10N.286.52.C2]|nr:hypothetical protein BCU94_11485 [Shewanella sp. 10N.286.52.C2]